MIFDKACGLMALTGIDTSLAPMPADVRFWFSKLVCSAEPGKRCDPRASRWYQSKTHTAPSGWVIVSWR